MTAPDSGSARRFAEEWVAAWNAHDLDRVLSHYDDQVTMASPFVVTLGGEPSGRLQGIAALREYWSKALSRLPGLHFELLDVLVGVDSLTLYYRGHRGMVAETFSFNSHGRVIAATACYSVDT